MFQWKIKKGKIFFQRSNRHSFWSIFNGRIWPDDKGLFLFSSFWMILLIFSALIDERKVLLWFLFFLENKIKETGSENPDRIIYYLSLIYHTLPKSYTRLIFFLGKSYLDSSSGNSLLSNLISSDEPNFRHQKIFSLSWIDLTAFESKENKKLGSTPINYNQVSL